MLRFSIHFNQYNPSPLRWGFIVGLYWMVGTGLAQSPLRLEATKGTQSLKKHLSVFVDSSNRMNLNQVVAAYRNGAFQSVNQEVFSFRVRSSIQWIHFSLLNTSSQELLRYLTISSAHINQVELFRDEHGNRTRVGIIGDVVPFRERLVRSPRLVFPFVVPPASTTAYWLKFTQTNGILLFGLSLQSERDFQRKVEREYLLWFVVFGVLLTLALFNGLLWVNLRQRLYLIYCFYVGSVVLYLAAETGLGFQFLWPESIRFQGLSRGITGISILFWWLWLMQSFVGQTPATSRWYGLIQVLKGFALVFLAMLVYSFLFVDYQNASGLTTLYLVLIDAGLFIGAILLGLSGSLFEQIRLKNRLAFYYAWATLPMLVGTLLGGLIRNQTIGGIADVYAVVALGIVLETLLVAFGFTFRYRLQQREKQQLQDALANANINLILAQETERRRLAADLHDDVGSSLIALRFKLPENEEARHLLNKIIQDVRLISHNLMPAELADLGLNYALDQAARRFENASGIRFLFLASGTHRALDEAAELTVYRLVLELMQNIVKHSGATEATVQMVYQESSLHITVEDNGRGFDANSPPKGGSGIGLKTVFSRITWLDGRVAMDSGAGGTTIRVDIPYTRVQDDPHDSRAAGRPPRPVQRRTGLATFLRRLTRGGSRAGVSGD